VLARMQPALQRCLERAEPAVVHATYELKVGSSGEVTDVSAEDAAAPAAVLECWKLELRKARFARPGLVVARVIVRLDRAY
jgi:hypothetical protein